MSIGLMFLHALVTGGRVMDLIGYGQIDHLFRGNEVEPYKYVTGHAQKFGALPSVDTVETHADVLKTSKEPHAYYMELLQRRHIDIRLRDAIQRSYNCLKVDNDPETALKVMSEEVMTLVRQQTQNEVVDLRQAYHVVIPNYASQLSQSDNYALRLGWKTFDDKTGGIMRGDMLSLIARTGQGKTWQLLYNALFQWLDVGRQRLINPDLEVECEHSRMFVSMEMEVLPIEQRLASIIASVPAWGVTHASLNSKNLKKLRHDLTEVQGFGAPFWILQGNLNATVEQLQLRARQLKPDAIFIDGAYLLKHPTEKDRFRRVAENAELIKQELTPIAPTVCSWQFAKLNKKGKGGKKSADEVDLEDIAYSDAIAQVSSIVLGLFETDSVETLIKRKVRILKGRHGERGQFETEWDFQNMRFGEIEAEPLSDLKFL